MREKTKQQIKWFTFQLLLIRMNPKLVDGKYSQPIIFDLDIIRNSTEPLFVKTPNVYATHFLEEIRGYYADKHNVAPENSGLKFNKIKNKLKIYGYTTATLKRYLKDEHDCLPSVFDTYKKNDKFYILFISEKTDIEISGDILTAFRMLHEKCYDENEYIKWDGMYNKMSGRRHLLLERNLNTQEEKMSYVYQTVVVKLARVLKNAIGDPDYNKDNIITRKYGGHYRLAI